MLERLVQVVENISILDIGTKCNIPNTILVACCIRFTDTLSNCHGSVFSRRTEHVLRLSDIRQH